MRALRRTYAQLAVAALASVVELVAFTAGAGKPKERPAAARSPLDDGPAVHVVARTLDDAGQTHVVELWRSGDRVRRRVDDRLEILAERATDGTRFRVLDLSKRREYHANALALARLGLFRSWDELATLTQAPPSKAKAEASGARSETSAGACEWMRVNAGSEARNICWSKALALALVVVRDSEKATMRELEVVSVENEVPDRALRGPDTRDFVVLDATEELTGHE